MVGPPGIHTHLIGHIMVNPAKGHSVIISGTPTDNQGAHSRKAKDNSIKSTVPRSIPITYERRAHGKGQACKGKVQGQIK